MQLRKPRNFNQFFRRPQLRSVDNIQTAYSHRQRQMTTVTEKSSAAAPHTHPPTGTFTDWEGRWAGGVEKKTGFDIGECEPELVYELNQARNKGVLADLLSVKPKARALVPGCGRGYAAAAFADAGFLGVGMDLSRTAMEIARTEFKQPGVEFIEGNFFETDVGTFDAIFDSTFLCAISPTAYRSWAKRMSELINPGGFLIMQVYPVSIDPNAPEIAIEGPNVETLGTPFRLTIKAVHELLKPYPFELVLFRETPEERAARRYHIVRGEYFKEYLMIWKKKSD
jgi:SAM-dependent methyltransferase